MGRFIEKGDKPWLWGGGGIVAGLAIGFAIAHVHTLQEWRWDIIAQPLATLGAGIAAIIAAWIAWFNGRQTRKQDKERALRERFTSIVEILSFKNEDLIKREAGAYALAALADDWADFYKDDPKSALQEQQVCLNILTSQLHDPITEEPQPQLLNFKERIQNLIFSNFINQENNGPGHWSDLKLNLSNCHVYKITVKGFFNRDVIFSGVNFVDKSRFINTTFSELTFKQSSFDHAYFNEVKFHGPARFHQVTFQGAASFYSAKFFDISNFFGSQFQVIAKFDQAEFHDRAYFADSTFLRTASFRKASFYGAAHFPKSEVNRPIDLSYSNFAMQESHTYIKDIKASGANLTDAKFDVDFSKNNKLYNSTNTHTHNIELAT